MLRNCFGRRSSYNELTRYLGLKVIFSYTINYLWLSIICYNLVGHIYNKKNKKKHNFKVRIKNIFLKLHKTYHYIYIYMQYIYAFVIS